MRTDEARTAGDQGATGGLLAVHPADRSRRVPHNGFVRSLFDRLSRAGLLAVGLIALGALAGALYGAVGPKEYKATAQVPATPLPPPATTSPGLHPSPTSPGLPP